MLVDLQIMVYIMATIRVEVHLVRPVLFMNLMVARWIRALLNLGVFHDCRPVISDKVYDSTIPHLDCRVGTAHLAPN